MMSANGVKKIGKVELGMIGGMAAVGIVLLYLAVLTH